MSSEIVFRSCEFPELAYSISWDHGKTWTEFGDPGFWAFARLFPTHGDGLVQHGPYEYIPPTPEAGFDFLMALGRHLLDNPEELDEVLKVWPQRISDWRILAAMKVRYSELKDRYYEKQSFKLSTSEKKRYDKRWRKVPVWADGSVRGTLELLMVESAVFDPMERLGICCDVEHLFNRLAMYRHVMEISNEHVFDLCGFKTVEGLADRETMVLMDKLRRVYRNVDAMVRGRERQRDAQRDMESCLNVYSGPTMRRGRVLYSLGR